MVMEQTHGFAPNAAFDCGGTLFVPTGLRHLIFVSNPKVTNGRMSVMLNIKDWDEYFCFYYPIESIDNQKLMCHVMYKFAGDSLYIIRASAEMDIEKTDPYDLNLRLWSFA
jgi:hypothetical protein